MMMMMMPSCSTVGFILLYCSALLFLTKQTAAFTNNLFPRTARNSVVGRLLLSAAADILPEIRDEIMEREGQLQEWEDSVKILTTDLFDNEEDAELYLADAFRWKAWAVASDMMKKYQRPVLPNAVTIQEGINWLRDGPLEMNNEQIRRNIEQYPGIYLREPNVMYRKVLGSAPRKYRDDTALKYLIETDPNVLQVTFNCGDEGCQSECGSCWVTYENRLPSVPDF
jgi:hypothetical protein